ncbi:MAG: Hydrogenase maturation factor HybG [Syntrophus sp. SKADARSKE-3]|nr:Hydrogenase maturation factor HybG [Syntrophus sp. SKADARSKE-3]
MCIAFPGKILSIDEDNIAIVDISGTRREVSLDIIDEEAKVGDYVISHAGFAIHKVDEDVAKDKLEFLKELIENEIY